MRSRLGGGVLCAILAFGAGACRSPRPLAPPEGPAAAGACLPSGTGGRAREVVNSTDSSLTESRARWAVSDMLVALNARTPADLALRYDWTGNLRARDDLLLALRVPGASAAIADGPVHAWWSDAPGHRRQTLCLPIDVQSNNFAGVPTTQSVLLRAQLLDDGRAAWLSRVEVLTDVR